MIPTIFGNTHGKISIGLAVSVVRIEVSLATLYGRVLAPLENAKCISGSSRKVKNSPFGLSLERCNLNGGIGQIFLLQNFGSLL